MRRILFVDDEPNILEGLENLLFPFVDDWEMHFVGSGAEALAWLERMPFDLVITDMRMPGMDGATLLHHVKEKHPDVGRIILSGHSELDAALRVMPIAHQFLSKPCNADTLVSVIDRACGLKELIGDEVVRGLLGNLGDLPTRPRVYSELIRLLADDGSSLGDVAAVVEDDIGISAKILHMANTAFFSRGHSVTSIREAIPRLGTTVIKGLVLAVEVFQGWERRGIEAAGFSIDELHDHSFVVARIAKGLLADREQAELAFLAGTLHDVGKLILAGSQQQQFAAALMEANRTRQPLYVVEEERARVSHAEIGAYLLGLWGLPYPVMEAVANHHRPQRARGREACFDIVGAVYVANVLAHELTRMSDCDEPALELDLEYLERLGVAQQVQGWRELARRVQESGA